MPNARYDKEARAARLHADLFKRRAIVILALIFGTCGVVVYVIIPVVAPLLGATPGKADPVVFIVLVVAVLVMLGVMSPGQALAFLQGFSVQWKRVPTPLDDDSVDDDDGGDDVARQSR